MILAGSANVYMIHVRLLSDVGGFSTEEFESSLLLGETLPIGSFISTEEISKDVQFLSSYSISGRYIFLTSDQSSLQIRSHRGDVICTLPASTDTQGRIHFAKFLNEAYVVIVYSDGVVLSWNISQKEIVWSHTISSLNSRNCDEHITCVSFATDLVLLGSNLGTCWVLEILVDESKGLCFSRERYHIAIDRYLRDGFSATGVNSVLNFSPQFTFNGNSCVLVITSLMIMIFNVDSGIVESSLLLASLCAQVPYLSCPLAMASTTEDAFYVYGLSSFERKLSVISVQKHCSAKTASKLPLSIFRAEVDISGESALSFFVSKDSAELPDSSPLSVAFEPSPGTTTLASGKHIPQQHSIGDLWEAPGRTKTGKLVDQPVTFHTRIKSSGYGQPDEFTKWRQKQQVCFIFLLSK